ncbi:MAG TPA: glycosyltransferase 87 family protein [Solirubrobacteraceae bacterium]|nr:glycosyltransferase 87 family protein [Solirubrobacteraceae bacterium]
MAAGALFLIWWVAIRRGPALDWNSEAWPAVRALLAGHLGRFLALSPAYGGSLGLRAPFMLSAELWHGSEWSVYTAGAVPALLASGALGIWLAARLRGTRRPLLGAGVAVLVCAANPLTLPALQYGHPEELLGAVLCAAAVVGAVRDRPAWAGLLLGLAIANKEWAVLGIGPVLVALPRHRIRTLVVACAIAGAVMAPFMLGQPGGGLSGSVAAAAQSTGQIFNQWQIWWFFGSHSHVVAGRHLVLPWRVAPGWINGVAHPLIVALMLPLTALYAWVRRGARRRRRTDALLLLALLLLLRCVLDPWDISYYALPFAMALAAWEVLGCSRPPVLALGASGIAWLIFLEPGGLNFNLSMDAQAILFTAVAVTALIALALAVYAPGAAGRRLAPRPREKTAAAPAAA